MSGMCMGSTGTSLGEADFNQVTRSSGIGHTPWLVAPKVGTSVRFTHFERMPDDYGNTPTQGKFMDQPSPQRQPMPGIEELKEKWPQYVSAARITWGEITEDELMNLKSHTQQLAGLIHARYAVTPAEADMQVRRFFAKHHV